jgi:hydroxypyruvate isomerase
LQIFAGEIHSLVGENGTRKFTTTKIMTSCCSRRAENPMTEKTEGNRLSRSTVQATGDSGNTGGTVAARLHAIPSAVKHGRIRQSLVYWCLNGSPWHWDIERICTAAINLGCPSVELVPSESWPVVRKHGLTCALAHNGMPDPVFQKGLNNPRYHEEVIARTKSAIDQAADFDIPNVVAFTGYKWRNAEDSASGEIPLLEGAANSVKALSELSVHARKKNVTLCLEHLNTRENSDSMKGHPGYQGDNIDYCADIVKQVNSNHVKLLFDIYHVQIMNGDVIRRLQQYRDLIGHVHTAGSPGRGELDDRQEINYPAIMRTLLNIGFKGYVGQEFMPTREPLSGLAQAVSLCDVA